MNKQKLPEGWKEVELGEVFDFQKKSKIKAGEGLNKGKYKFFTSSDKQTKFIDEYTQDGEYLIFATGGHAGIHYCNEKFSTSTDCFIVKVKDKIIAKYVYYYLYGKIYLLEEGFKGAGLKHISKGYIQDIKVYYPENKEIQKKIVSILEKAEKAKELRKETDELTKDFLKSVFLEMFGDPIKNEQRWNNSTIGDNLTEIKYGTGSPPEYVKEGIKFIRATNIKQGRIIENGILYINKDEAKKIEKCKLKENDLIIVRSGVNTGDCAVVTKKYVGSYGGYDIIFHLNNDILNSVFLNELLNLGSSRAIIKTLSRRAGQPHLNSRQISDFKIIFPPTSLQNKFASIVKEVEAMKEQQKHSKNQIDNLFNALMQKAFKGELII